MTYCIVDHHGSPDNRRSDHSHRSQAARSVCGCCSPDENTVLCIQGPPGTGKTYTAAHAILGLLRDGKTIGVTANSHKAILNVLRAVHEAMQKAGEDFPIVKVGETDGDPLVASGAIRKN